MAVLPPYAAMKFFFPQVLEPDQERNYQAAKRLAERNGQVTARRYCEIHYSHQGKPFVARVGKQDDQTGKTVLAIFQSAHDEKLFLLVVGIGYAHFDGGMARVDNPDHAIEFDAE